jgi:hypothetical protein
MAVALPFAAQGSLLGVQDAMETPLIDFDAGGTVTYDSTTDILSLDATVIFPSAGLDPGDLLPNGGSIILTIEVDDTGALVDGSGALTVLSGSGDLLLSADVTSFGWEAGAIDKFDFTLDNLAGPEAGDFVTAGMFFNVDSVGSFGGDWTTDFSRTPTKGSIGNLVP